MVVLRFNSPKYQTMSLSDLANLILLTYILKNSDCHSKNVALLYQSRTDIWLATVYDMLSTTVYEDYAKNPPELPLASRSTWKPGKALEIFLQTRCNIRPSEQKQRIEKICNAVVSVTPDVIAATQSHPHFYETGKRMLHAWNEGMNSMRLHKSWSLPSLKEAIDDAKFSDPQTSSAKPKDTFGRSPLLAKR